MTKENKYVVSKKRLVICLKTALLNALAYIGNKTNRTSALLCDFTDAYLSAQKTGNYKPCLYVLEEHKIACYQLQTLRHYLGLKTEPLYVRIMDALGVLDHLIQTKSEEEYCKYLTDIEAGNYGQILQYMNLDLATKEDKKALKKLKQLLKKWR
jgi:hypothetical protein